MENQEQKSYGAVTVSEVAPPAQPLVSIILTREGAQHLYDVLAELDIDKGFTVWEALDNYLNV